MTTEGRGFTLERKLTCRW